MAKAARKSKKRAGAPRKAGVSERRDEAKKAPAAPRPPAGKWRSLPAADRLLLTLAALAALTLIVLLATSRARRQARALTVFREATLTIGRQPNDEAPADAPGPEVPGSDKFLRIFPSAEKDPGEKDRTKKRLQKITDIYREAHEDPAFARALVARACADRSPEARAMGCLLAWEVRQHLGRSELDVMARLCSDGNTTVAKVAAIILERLFLVRGDPAPFLPAPRKNEKEPAVKTRPTRLGGVDLFALEFPTPAAAARWYGKYGARFAFDSELGRFLNTS